MAESFNSSRTRQTRLAAPSFAAALIVCVLASGCAASRPAPQQVWPRYSLSAQRTIRLNLPGGRPFDASGLWRFPSGQFLTVNNRHAGVYRVEFLADGQNANLARVEDCFNATQLSALGTRAGEELDCEGLAADERGRIYLCEESRRWILRCAPGANRAERLPIDWSPVQKFFSAADPNASFEGIAIGGDTLFVANERNSPLIIAVDLNTLKVRNHFTVYPTSPSWLGTHYSDLVWFKDRLWVLLRHERVVLEVDPRRPTVLAEYDFRALEDELGYQKHFPTGIMEGLWVDRDGIWLLTDNNGLGLQTAPADRRPTLVQCGWPMAQPKESK